MLGARYENEIMKREAKRIYMMTATDCQGFLVTRLRENI